MGHSPREGISQQDKYLGFQKAFATVTSYRNVAAWLAAYVVAFSLFEDRVAAARMLAADLAGERRPDKDAGHARRVTYLQTKGHISNATARAWIEAGQRRNTLFHAAMWTVGAVTDRDVSSTLKLARAADSLASRLKRAASAAHAR